MINQRVYYKAFAVVLVLFLLFPLFFVVVVVIPRLFGVVKGNNNKIFLNIHLKLIILQW